MYYIFGQLIYVLNIQSDSLCPEYLEGQFMSHMSGQMVYVLNIWTDSLCPTYLDRRGRQLL